MKYADFEDYLQQKFFDENPMVLDDDWPDSYSDWESGLDISDLIRWANDYTKEVLAQNINKSREV